MVNRGPWLVVEGPSGGMVLRPGRVVKAKVVELGGHGRVRVRVGGVEFEATCHLVLRPGEVLTLKVEEIYPRVVFKVLEPERAGVEAALARALATLAHSAPRVGVMMARVMDLEPRAWPPEAVAALGRLKQALAKCMVGRTTGLREAARAMGLGLEQALARGGQIEGMRAELARTLAVAPPGGDKALLDSLAAVLEAAAVACGGLQALEAEGIVVLGMEDGGALELWARAGAEVGVWIGFGAGDQLGLSMRVEMQKVALEVLSPRPEAVSALEAALPKLSELLKNAGFELEATVEQGTPEQVVGALVRRYPMVVSLKV